MATSALRELQMAFMPAAIGTVAVIYSNIVNMGIMGKIRYADKQPVHPYKPWADQGDKAEPHFRAFKACQNGTEWTVYVVPTIWLYTLYTPAIPVIGKYLPWVGVLLSLGVAYYNIQYVKGYIESADGRMPGFKKRTQFVRGLFYGTIGGIICAVASAFGLF